MQLIKSKRNELNMTQEDLAMQTGLTRQAISAYENHVAKPSVDTAKKIAHVLNIDWRDLYEEEQA